MSDRDLYWNTLYNASVIEVTMYSFKKLFKETVSLIILIRHRGNETPRNGELLLIYWESILREVQAKWASFQGVNLMLWWSISADMLTFEISRYFARSRQSQVDSPHKWPMPEASNSELWCYGCYPRQADKRNIQVAGDLRCLNVHVTSLCVDHAADNERSRKRENHQKPKLRITDPPGWK